MIGNRLENSLGLISTDDILQAGGTDFEDPVPVVVQDLTSSKIPTWSNMYSLILKQRSLTRFVSSSY